MSCLNYYGLFLMILIMLPNIVFSLTNKDEFENKYTNKIIIIIEQIGRYCCFALMIINIPYLYKGYWFKNSNCIYLLVNSVLISFYYFFWIIYWEKNCVIKSILLSLLPSCIFIFSGIITLYIPLIIAGILFSFCHIQVSYKNAVL